MTSPGLALAVAVLVTGGHPVPSASGEGTSRPSDETPAEAPEPRPVGVPAALARAVGAPELSGLAWSPDFSRWLVVSDDTGARGSGRRHTPAVLAMDGAGELDAAPVPIAGIDALDDPEAICAGPAGTFFLATSHSPDRAGRTPRARRQLLQLRPEGRRLVVVGRVDLTAVEGPRSLLAIAGLPEDGRLDVEAIAYRGGALFVGLKSPLAASGGAVVLRLVDPAAAARAGRIDEGALSPWAELPLCLDAGGERVCQGLADMAFLEDGSLVVAANAPKGGRPDGGGALWWVPAPVGAASPRLLHRFPGQRPEGVATTPGGRTLGVVFDGGGAASRWLELPLPADAIGRPTPARAARSR